jgi:hypothetical protein
MRELEAQGPFSDRISGMAEVWQLHFVLLESLECHTCEPTPFLRGYKRSLSTLLSVLRSLWRFLYAHVLWT